MRIIRFTAALLIAFCIGLTACGGGGSKDTTPPPPPTLSSITVTSTGTVVVGMTVQFKAEGKYSDGSTKDLTSSATWSSSDSTIATVSTAGLVTGVAAGSVNIKAASGSVSNQAALAVKKATITALAVTSSATTVPLGGTQQLVANATYENNTTAPVTDGVTWTSSDSSVISVDNTGLATAIAATGTADIIATVEGKASPAMTLAASAAAPKALMIYPPSLSLAVNQWVQPTTYLIYTDRSAQDVSAGTTLTVADADTAILSTQLHGTVVIGKTLGMTKLNASYHSLRTSTDLLVDGALAGLTVAPRTATIHQGGEALFTANGTFDNGKEQAPLKYVVWSSDDPAEADFTGGGYLVGKSAGAVQVTGELGGFRDMGTAIIDGLTRQSAEISPALVDMAVSVTKQLGIIATFSDGTNSETQTLTKVGWQTSDSSVAIVDNNGLVTSVSPGTAVITATLPDSTQLTATVNVAHGVKDHLEITSDNENPKVGDLVHLKATVYLTDGRSFDVTSVAIWQTMDSEVALVDANGAVITRKAGTVTIKMYFDGALEKTVAIGPIA